MQKRSWVYIITDKPYGTLYTGVTADLSRRAYEHRNGIYQGFSKHYRLKLLVYIEEYPTILEAIAREKAMKKWNRDWKIQAIEKINPQWRDLYQDINK